MKKSVLQPPERPNQSAFDRLRAWPVVFNVNQATRYLGAGDNDMASVYLARWKKSGMVQSTGPRSGVYFNLVANPKAAEEHLVDALLFAFSSAVLIGASVLHDAGWTTQIPKKLQIACLAEREGRRTVPVWDQVEFFLRPRGWYQQFHGQMLRGENYGALASLTPAAALVDAVDDEAPEQDLRVVELAHDFGDAARPGRGDEGLLGPGAEAQQRPVRGVVEVEHGAPRPVVGEGDRHCSVRQCDVKGCEGRLGHHSAVVKAGLGQVFVTEMIFRFKVET